MAKAPPPHKPDHDAIASDVLAETVDRYRNRGLTDEALIAVGAAGVRQALAQWDPKSGQRFEAWCRMWVDKAIELALDSRGEALARPAAIAPGDFAKDVRAREARLVDKLAKALAHHRDELIELVGEAKVSSYALAFFDLFSQRFEEAIEPWLAGQLGGTEFTLARLVLPADGATAWAMEVALADGAEVARFEIDGWALRSVKRP